MGSNFSTPCFREPHEEVEIRDHRRAGVLRDLHRVAHMIAVAVGDEMWVAPSTALSRSPFQAGLPGEEGVDEHDLVGEVETKGRMAEPGDLHERNPPGRELGQSERNDYRRDRRPARSVHGL
jgi:hypothetical protein